MIPALGLGLVVGVVLGVVGGGGSIIAVPALVYGVGMSPAQAIPTSLLVVGISSLAALLPRFREGLNWPVIALVGGAGIPAAWAGAAVGKLLDPNILMLAFAVIMVAAGIRMLSKPRESEGSCSTGPNRAFRSCAPKAVGVGLLVGFLTGLLGVGGGFLITPALTIFLGLRMKQAVGTSLAIIVVMGAGIEGYGLPGSAPTPPATPSTGPPPWRSPSRRSWDRWWPPGSPGTCRTNTSASRSRYSSSPSRRGSPPARSPPDPSTEENTMGLIDSLKKAFSKPYKTISVAQAKELLGSGATLIDVRSAQEWRTGRAPQAKHVPLDRLQTSTAGIQKTRPVIAVCASGVRSASAARLLAAKGYDAYSVRGGMAAWRQAGEPVR